MEKTPGWWVYTPQEIANFRSGGRSYEALLAILAKHPLPNGKARAPIYDKKDRRGDAIDMGGCSCRDAGS